jgi:hypothetical protein
MFRDQIVLVIASPCYIKSLEFVASRTAKVVKALKDSKYSQLHVWKDLLSALNISKVELEGFLG